MSKQWTLLFILAQFIFASATMLLLFGIIFNVGICSVHVSRIRWYFGRCVWWWVRSFQCHRLALALKHCCLAVVMGDGSGCGMRYPCLSSHSAHETKRIHKFMHTSHTHVTTNTHSHSEYHQRVDHTISSFLRIECVWFGMNECVNDDVQMMWCFWYFRRMNRFHVFEFSRL